jgi:hypothetical protein
VLAPCREREREREKNEKRGREMDAEGQMVKNDLYMGDIFPPVAFFFFWRATERERERERERLSPLPNRLEGRCSSFICFEFTIRTSLRRVDYCCFFIPALLRNQKPFFPAVPHFSFHPLCLEEFVPPSFKLLF